MSINSKIEEIRRKPDHIKLRYIWLCVFVSMFVIFLIWIFSISLLFKDDGKINQKNLNNNSLNDLKNQLNSIKQPSVNLKENLLPKENNNSQEGVSNPTKNDGSSQNSDFQYPLPSDTSNTDQSQEKNLDNINNTAL